MHRVWLGVDSGDPVRKQTRHHVARVAREGILMWIRTKLPVHALSLDRSRFRRSRHKANTASCSMCSSCVNPLLDMNKSPLCMHRVWKGVDSGVPVTKPTWHHVAFGKRSLLAFFHAKFSSRVNMHLEASLIFRPTPHTKFLV